MRIHLLEHDTHAGPTNIDRWAEERGHRVWRWFLNQRIAFPGFDHCDLLVVTGALIHVWEESENAYLAPEKAYIGEALDRGKPVVGLCFGAQLLAEALGGSAYAAEHPEIGWHDVELNQSGRENSLLNGLPDRFTTFHWHSDHFHPPAQVRTLAASALTPHQIFDAPGRPVLALQCHLEYTPDLIRHYTAHFRAHMTPGPHTTPPRQILARLENLPDPYALMSPLLDNVRREFC
jgi:GMP synthase-like glutamine amidotransferase